MKQIRGSNIGDIFPSRSWAVDEACIEYRDAHRTKLAMLVNFPFFSLGYNMDVIHDVSVAGVGNSCDLMRRLCFVNAGSAFFV